MRRATMTEQAPRAPRSLRRHIASAILLIGILLIGNLICVAHDKVVPVEIRYLLGSPPIARRIDVALVPRGGTEPAVTFWREPAASVTTHRPRMRPGIYVAEITLTRHDGTTRRASNPIDVVRDAVIEIDLREER